MRAVAQLGWHLLRGVKLLGLVLVGIVTAGWALFCLLVAALVLFWPLLPTTQDRDRRSADEHDNWAAFCQTRDCTKYPIGYKTVDVPGSPMFFFPVATRNGSLNPEGTFFLDYTGWREKPFQSVTTSPGRVQALFGIVTRLLRHFDLTSWPPEIDVPPNMTLKFIGNSRWKIDKHGNSALGMEATAPFNSDFDIAYQDYEVLKRTFHERLSYRKFALISKNPILLGRKAIFRCDQDCEIFSSPQPDEPAGRDFQVTFSRVFLYGRVHNPFDGNGESGPVAIVAEECAAATSPLIDCDHLDRKLVNLGKAIQMLDLMLAKLQLPPEATAE